MTVPWLQKITTWLKNIPAPISWRTLFVYDNAVSSEVAQHVSVRLRHSDTIPLSLHHGLLIIRDHVWNQIPQTTRNSYQKNIFFSVLSKAPIRNNGGIWHRNLPAGDTFEGSLRVIYYLSTQTGSSIQFTRRNRNRNYNINGVPLKQNFVCNFEKLTVPNTTVFFENSKCYHRVASNGTASSPQDQRVFISFTFLPMLKNGAKNNTHQEVIIRDKMNIT